MEFEDLQKIWNTQTNQHMYVIDQDALHKRIIAKKISAHKITNVSELLSIIVNIASGAIVLGVNFSTQKQSWALYIMSIWMFGSAALLLNGRIRRISGSNKPDRSILGDLTYAVSVATYQVRLSRLMRWNILPIGILSLIGVWESGKSIWIIVVLAVCFAGAYALSGWEHNFYKSRKRELEALHKKLSAE